MADVLLVLALVGCCGVDGLCALCLHGHSGFSGDGSTTACLAHNGWARTSSEAPPPPRSAGLCRESRAHVCWFRALFASTPCWYAERPTVVVSSVTGRGVAAPALFGISQATVGLGNFEEVAVLKTGAAFSLGLVSFSFVPALVRAPSAKYFLWLSVIFFRSGLVEHLCHVGHYNLLSVAPHGDPAGALPTGVE